MVCMKTFARIVRTEIPTLSFLCRQCDWGTWLVKSWEGSQRKSHDIALESEHLKDHMQHRYNCGSR